MGADQSSLSEWTAEDVVNAVSALGEQYPQYADAIRSNNINGPFLQKLRRDGIEEKLVDLGVSSRLHRRVLIKKIAGARKQCSAIKRSATAPVSPTEAPFRRQGSLPPEEKAKLWTQMKAAADRQRQENEELMRREAELRSEVAHMA